MTTEEYDPDISFDRQDTGTCTRCGAEDTELYIVDDEERVCMDCLDACYTRCDRYGEYWEDGFVEFYDRDGDRICEYCAEELDDEEDEDEEEDEEYGGFAEPDPENCQAVVE